MNLSRITFSPLLNGKIQFRKIKKQCLLFLKKEVELRGLNFNDKSGIRALAKLTKDCECKNWEN